MKSILIADSNARVADMFAQIFASHGWTVASYGNSGRAIDALRGNAYFDAVLLGYQFADLNGIEMIEQIRMLDHRRGVPIVIVTGAADSSIVDRALAAGADEVLRKPTDVMALVSTVSKCVERGRHHD
jgi:two-component system, NarL family, sensor histidine kinase EvgS